MPTKLITRLSVLGALSAALACGEEPPPGGDAGAAFWQPFAPPARSVDARPSEVGQPRGASVPQLEALERLRADLGDLHLRLDADSGVTRALSHPTDYLTGPQAGTALDAALAFVERSPDLLGLSPTDVADYEVTDVVFSAVSGATHVYLRQVHAGIAVYNGQLQVHVNRDGRIIAVNNAFVPMARVAGPAPRLDAEDAVLSAAEHLGAAARRQPTLESTARGPRQRSRLHAPDVSREPIDAELFWLPVGSGEVRLVWNLQVATLDQEHVYDLTVDADNGDVWTRFDWVADAGYRIYPQPVESPNHTTPLPPADARMVVIDPASPIASPHGWHDTNGVAGAEFTIMRGNNAHAYEDSDNNGAPPSVQPDCGAALDCNFPLDLALAPSTYRPAATANLFHWNNVIHDVQYLYGFDEIGGNFQVNNYGRGGLGNDDVRAEAQDGGGTNNANFLTPADGSRPRMQMYLWNATSPARDGDFDDVIIAHEYGHGVSNRQVGGPSNVSCLQNAQQPGEGWSDWLGLWYTVRAGDSGATPRGVGTYVRGQATDGPGIRTQRYSTDPAINTWTYETIRSAVAPHGVGAVWAQGLWEVYWRLVADHGFDPNPYDALGAAGNQRAMLYVNEGMKNTACSPTFLDARDGIIAAAVDNHGGQDVCRLWEAFAAYGLGSNASTTGSNSSATNGFAIPVACQCSPQASANAGPDHYICLGASAALGTAEQAGHTYLWTPGGETTAQITVAPTETTTYGLTATTACGSKTDSAVVIVDDTSGPGISEDFESGAAGWTTSGLWHLAESSSCASPGYSSPLRAMYYGSDASCSYDTGAATSGDLLSPQLYGIAAGSTLRFRYFRAVQTATSALDRTEVLVSRDNGGSWASVWLKDARSASENAWSDSGRIALGAYAGSPLRLRFRFDSVDAAANGFAGWLIDDVVVTGASACDPANTAPDVEIAAPAAGASAWEGSPIAFAGSSYDVESGDLGSAIAWASSLDGAIGTGKSFSRTLSIGSHTITATSTDAGGLADAASVTIEVVADTFAPEVALTAPAPGATLTGTVTLSATATDNVGVTRVELYDGTTLLASDSTAPYATSWNTRLVANGAHTIVAKAFDAVGNVGTASVEVLVDNDTTPPTVSITSPAEGAAVSGAVLITAAAADDRALAQVRFYADSALLLTDTVAPYETTWDSTAKDNSTVALRAEAMDASGNLSSVSITVTVANSGRASYDSALRAPACRSLGNRCAALTLVNGRAGLGPEPSQPNTINSSCADGTSGSYHSRQSLDKLSLETLDGGDFQTGKSVRVTATVWVYSTTWDHLDLYYTANAAAPSWTFIGTVRPVASGAQTLSATYTLPSGTLQAVRGQWRYSGSASICTSGSYNDRDDLVFAAALDPTPPAATLTAPAEGSVLVGPVTLTASASDNLGVARVELHAGGALLGSDTTAPYALNLDSRTLPNGAHVLGARAVDIDGNSAESPSVNVTVDNELEPPVVTLGSPQSGAVVRGTVTISADASDNRGVTRVEILVDSSLIATLSAPPYSHDWSSTTVSNASHTITARAFDASGNQASASAGIIVDNSAPAVSFTAPLSGAIMSGTITVSASASDNRGVTLVSFYDGESLLGSRSTAPYSIAWDTTAALDGAHVLSASAHDQAGNSTVVTRSITVDNGDPSVSITSPADMASVTGTVGIQLSATDAATSISRVDVFVDGLLAGSDTSAPYAVAWDTSLIVNGAYVLDARAYDAAGNSADATPVSVTVDNELEPPVVALTQPSGGALLRGSITLAADATDNRGVARVEFLVDGTLVATSTAAPYSVTWNSASAASGSHSLTARAVDVSNNAATSAPVAITTDNTLPSVALTAPNAGSTLAGRVTVSATASDNLEVARVELYAGATLIGSAGAAPYAASWDTASFANGAYSLSAHAYDTAGNVAISAARSVNVDNTAPAVSLTAPASGAVVRSTVTLAAAATDNLGIASVEFFVDGSSVGSDSTSPYALTWWTTLFSEGAHELTAVARDLAGLTTTSTMVSVTVDNSAPAVALTAPAEGALVGTSVTMSADASDLHGIAKVEFYRGSILVGTDTTAPYQIIWSTGGALSGPYVLTARAFDTPGNLTTSAAVNVTLDSASPSVSFTAPAYGAVVGGVVSVQISASDNTAVERVELHDGSTLIGTLTTAPYAFSWDTTGTAEGSHTLAARAYDTVGNMRLETRSVTVDNIAPTVSVTAPVAGARVRASVTVSAAASDAVGVSAVELFVDGLSLGSDTTSPYAITWNTSTWADGSHSVTAVARDRAGHATTSAAVSVTVDNSVPSVSLTAPAEGALVGRGGATLSADASDPSGIARVEFYRGTTFIGSDTTAPYSMSWSTSSLLSGPYVLTARAYDVPGNSATSAAVNVTLDSASPTVAFVTPGAGAIVGGVVSVQLSASDNVAVQRVELLDNGVLVGTLTTEPYSFSWDTTGKSEGSHTLQANVYDTAANVATISRSVTVDNVAPTVSFSAPASGAKVRAVITVSATASDGAGLSAVEFYADGLSLGSDATSPYSVVWDTSLWADGSRTLTAVARDRAGHETTATRSVTLDNTAPTVRLTSPSDGATVGITVSLAAEAADADGVSRVDFYRGSTLVASDSSAPFATTWWASGTSGAYTMTASAYDAAGNVGSSAPITVTFDTVRPTVSWVAPASASIVQGTVTLEAAASDDVGIARVEFYDGFTLLGTATAAPYTVSWDTIGVFAPYRYIHARAHDTAGNAVSTSDVTLYIDNTPPSLTLTSPAANGYATGLLTISASAYDNSGVASVEFYGDGELLGIDTAAPYAALWDTLLLPEGLHDLQLVARDNVGHVRSLSTTVTFDHTAPSVTITKPRDGSRVRGDVYVEWVADDNMALRSVTFYMDGQPIHLATAWPGKRYFQSEGFSNGDHVLTARALDGAGNTTESAPIRLTVNN